MTPARYADLQARHPGFNGEILHGDGWFDILDRLLTALEARGATVDFAKQKLGGMRVGVERGTPELFDIVLAAEAESRVVCEVCGAKGSIENQRPLAARCSAHRETSVAAVELASAVNVASVQALPGYKLDIMFSDGTQGVADLSRDLDGGLNKLIDPELWKLAHIRHGAVTWNDELDIAPEFLYLRIHGRWS